MLTESTAPFVAHCVGKTLDAGRLELVEVIGEGANGVVYRAVERHGDASSSKASTPTKQYAVKVLPKAADWSVLGQCQSREIVTHKIASSHPNVLTLHDVLEDETALYLVLDYCPGGDLFSAIVDRRVFARNDALVKSVFVQLLDAVQSCHDQGIYHRDLKPDNVFVSADGTEVLLGDFGLATDQVMSTSHRCGSSSYMSPECIGEEQDFHSYYNEISDIWSLGVILTNMICARNPWRMATTNDAHFYEYMSNADSLREMFQMSKEANDVLKRVFTFNPSQRISLAELRTAVLAVDTFFPTEGGPIIASKPASRAVAECKPITFVIATPDLPYKATFESMHDYPDEEYLFTPGTEEHFLFHPRSEVSTPSTEFSDTDTLFDVTSPGFSSKGKELDIQLGEENEDSFVQEKNEDSFVQEKYAGISSRPGARLLARLLA